MNILMLLERCRTLGATFIPLADGLRIKAPAPLPDDLISDLKIHKDEVLAELRFERRKRVDCWLLEEWRRSAIPEWRRILQVSKETNDPKREEYARWMLREILNDPDYTEEQ